MRKMILFLSLYLLLPHYSRIAKADEAESIMREHKVERFISEIYDELDFGFSDKLPYDAFDLAYRGYVNLRNDGKLNSGREIITVCDFELSSKQKRLWVIDLKSRKILFNTLVAHGQGSGEEYAMSFSNKPNSHKSSLGLYVTGETYDGDHGMGLRLRGMDEGFNDAAFDRDIVVHGADYVSDKFICKEDKLGRSWGCPALPTDLTASIINTIKDSTCLFIYYPEHKYLNTAYWVNKKVTNLPR